MSIESFFGNVPGLRDYVASMGMSATSPQNIPGSRTRPRVGSGNTNAILTPAPMQAIQAYLALGVAIYIMSKSLQTWIGFDNVKSSLEESINFMALLIMTLVLAIFRSTTSETSIVLLTLGAVVGMFIPPIMAGLKHQNAKLTTVAGWIVAGLLVIAYLGGLATAPSFRPVFIIIGVAILLIIAVMGIPADKRISTIDQNKEGDLLPGATLMLITPKLRISSPMVFFLATLTTAPIGSFVGQMISAVFLGAFASSLALYGNLWLFTDSSLLKPANKEFKLDQSVINEIQGSSEVETLKWGIGLVILMSVLSTLYTSVAA